MVVISRVDVRGALIGTLVPGAAAVVSFAAFINDKEVIDWWEKLKKPKWAPREVAIYSSVDLLTLSPLGCAAYLVYKHGNGFENLDTRIALASYGLNFGLGILAIPLTTKRNLKGMFLSTVLIFVNSSLMSALFYRIYKKAGLFVIPYNIWIGFYVAMMYSIWRENGNNEIKPASKTTSPFM